MRNTIVQSLALLATMPIVASAGNTLVFGNVSAWTVRTDPENGYRCFAEAEYTGGSFMRIGYESPDSTALYLAVSDSMWDGVAAGQQYALTLQFDDAESRPVVGTGLGSGDGFKITVSAAERASFLESFSRGYSISISRDGQDEVMLSLGGTLSATRMLDECQSSMTRLS